MATLRALKFTTCSYLEYPTPSMPSYVSLFRLVLLVFSNSKVSGTAEQ